MEGTETMQAESTQRRRKTSCQRAMTARRPLSALPPSGPLGAPEAAAGRGGTGRPGGGIGWRSSEVRWLSQLFERELVKVCDGLTEPERFGL